MPIHKTISSKPSWNTWEASNYQPNSILASTGFQPSFQYAGTTLDDVKSVYIVQDNAGAGHLHMGITSRSGMSVSPEGSTVGISSPLNASVFVQTYAMTRLSTSSVLLHFTAQDSNACGINPGETERQTYGMVVDISAFELKPHDAYVIGSDPTRRYGACKVLALNASNVIFSYYRSGITNFEGYIRKGNIDGSVITLGAEVNLNVPASGTATVSGMFGDKMAALDSSSFLVAALGRHPGGAGEYPHGFYCTVSGSTITIQHGASLYNPVGSTMSRWDLEHFPNTSNFILDVGQQATGEVNKERLIHYLEVENGQVINHATASSIFQASVHSVGLLESGDNTMLATQFTGGPSDTNANARLITRTSSSTVDIGASTQFSATDAGGFANSTHSGQSKYNSPRSRYSVLYNFYEISGNDKASVGAFVWRK